RIIAQGAGTFTAYKEPTGPGIRVDSCGYLGYAPPPQFDPMFGKLICSSNSSQDYASAIDRSLRALDEFHISGVATNLGQLRAILSRPELRAGDARTTLLSDNPDLASTTGKASDPLALFEQQARTLSRGAAPVAPTVSSGPSLSVQESDEAAEAPMGGAIVEVT